MARRHLLTVWNPAYGGNAIEAHLRVFLEAAREHQAGRCARDDVYVWWGKVRSPNRLQPIPHLADILAIQAGDDPDDPAHETHVYLTDYQSLYVAHLGEVTETDPTKEDSDRVPEYYWKEELTCDFWLQLWDIRRLVSDDLAMVVDELGKLTNVRYQNRPVTMYGGMVELPLIVEETEASPYFDEASLTTWTGGRFWAEYDAEHGGVGQMERELRENLLGEKVWSAFNPETRLFLATAEKLFREHRHDALFDFSTVLVEYCKAMEVHCNLLLRRALPGAPEPIRYWHRDRGNRPVDLAGNGQPLALGELSRAIGEEAERAAYLNKRLENGTWFTGQLPAILGGLSEPRGGAAHSKAIDRDEMVRLRAQLVGVGSEGHFTRLGLTRVRT